MKLIERIRGTQKQKGELVLAITVDEHSLVYLLAELKGATQRVVEYSVQYNGASNGTILVEGLLADITKRFLVHRVLVSFTAPYLYIRAIQCRAGRIGEEATLITKEEAKTTSENLYTHSTETLKKQLVAESGILPEEFSVGRVHSLQWKIDGYQVPTIEGFKGSSIEATVVGTFVRNDVARTVESIRKRYRRIRTEVMHPFEGVWSSGLQGVFLYIGEERAQLCVSTKTQYALSESFYGGRNTFFDLLGKKFGMVQSAAEDFWDRYVQGTLEANLQEKMKHILLPEVQNFVTLVKDQLDHMDIGMPSELFVFGKGSRMKDMLDVFGAIHATGGAMQDGMDTHTLLPADMAHPLEFSHNNDPRYSDVCLLLEMIHAKESY
jgi:hypothetical protein